MGYKLKGTSIFIFFIAISLFFSSVGVYFASDTVYSDVSKDIKRAVIVLDAGHGGEDGGASAYGNVPEKELNLKIAQTLCDMLRFCGSDVIMTRSEDVLLYDKSSDYHGKKKSQDLAKRLEIANSAEDAILISIHMNAFPEAKYKGLQVYYSPNNESSYTLASLVQNQTRIKLMPDNSRKVKKADGSIYLLNRYEGTGILIECGFLSNPEEYAKLCTDEYRTELSLVLLGAISEYLADGGR